MNILTYPSTSGIGYTGVLTYSTAMAGARQA
jgi:hypothetical protein